MLPFVFFVFFVVNGFSGQAWDRQNTLGSRDASGQTPGIYLLAPDSGALPGMRVK